MSIKSCFMYSIVHINGKKNVIADALNRCYLLVIYRYHVSDKGINMPTE